MTQFPSPNSPDFDRLRTFLQENAPQAPEPAPDLEMQLMSAIDTLPQDRPQRLQKRWWILSAAIVTGLGLLWGGRAWQMAQNSDPVPSETELLALQNFVEDTWGIVGYVDTTDTWNTTPWLTLNRTDSL
ncbi:MAG: hypothetical protein ACO37W_01405 [Prochlorotrichaceae cyanobacterium]